MIGPDDTLFNEDDADLERGDETPYAGEANDYAV